MEYSSMVNQKWLLCCFASFLGFLLLVLCINQSQRSAPVLLQSLKSSDPTPLNLFSQWKLADGAPPESSFVILAPAKSPITHVNDQFAPSPLAISTQANTLNSTSTSFSTSPLLLDGQTDEPKLSELEKNECNLFDGKWVYDPKTYPIYRASWCPFLSEQVSCQKNGRTDSFYEHWRWEPRGCDLPRFDGKQMLETLRGKRVVIVGDSLNRNQWESLTCLLYSSSRKLRTLVKPKAGDYKIFRAMDYNVTVEFFWSPFLVKLEEGDSGKVLKLQKLSSSSKRWLGADVMVFNTGHWWTHRGKWDYYERKGELVAEMDQDLAFQTALKTWARWVDRRVDPTKTTVLFRSISPEHKSNRHWCYNQTYPITNTTTYVQRFPKSMRSIVERTIKKMKTPIKYLNITKLSEYRRDAHTSVYTTRQGRLLNHDQRQHPAAHADCSHWCLPGLPDTWNVLLYATLTRTLSTIS